MVSIIHLMKQQDAIRTVLSGTKNVSIVPEVKMPSIQKRPTAVQLY
jgi:hypothetical protein